MHNFYHLDGVVTINLEVDENGEVLELVLDSNSDDVKEVRRLVQQLVDIGEFTAHRPFDQDPFEDYYIENSYDTPQLGLSIETRRGRRSCIWYYQHDEGPVKAGIPQIAEELDKIFLRMKARGKDSKGASDKSPSPSRKFEDITPADLV